MKIILVLYLNCLIMVTLNYLYNYYTTYYYEVGIKNKIVKIFTIQNTNYILFKIVFFTT